MPGGFGRHGAKMAECQSIKNIHEIPIISLFYGTQLSMGFPDEVLDRADTWWLYLGIMVGRPHMQRLGLFPDCVEHFPGLGAAFKLDEDQVLDAGPPGKS